jgi:hypothetical protein
MNDTEMHPVCEKLVAYLETGEAATVDGAPTPEGFVMELEERWRDANGDWYCREAIIARVREGRIDRLAVYRTGDWDEARQATHAAQVRLLEA